MKLSISMAGHRGKVRQKNEDNLYVNGLMLEKKNDGLTPRSIQTGTEEARLVGVFDGMGGYAAGEYASFLAASTAAELMTAHAAQLSGEELMLRICQLANTRVCEAMQQGSFERIGTTASMLHLSRDRYTICNVGDSPVFLYRDGALQMISQEHTERANYERITGKKAPPNKKFRLTQNIGIFEDEMLIEPYCASDEIRSGDCFLLCSDGLTDMVSTEVIADVLSSGSAVQQKVETLLQMALDNGGKDNITIVLVCAEEEILPPTPRKRWPLVLAAGVVLLAVAAAAWFCFGRCQDDDAAGEPSTTATETVETTVPTETVETTAPTETVETTTPTETAETTAPTETVETTAPTETTKTSKTEN